MFLAPESRVDPLADRRLTVDVHLFEERPALIYVERTAV